MINELKEETQKLVSDLKKDVSRQTKWAQRELQTDEWNWENHPGYERGNKKEIEILTKKNESEINSSISQIKISIKSLVNRVEQKIEDQDEKIK
jgi:hypothetical protein